MMKLKFELDIRKRNNFHTLHRDEIFAIVLKLYTKVHMKKANYGRVSATHTFQTQIFLSNWTQSWVT